MQSRQNRVWKKVGDWDKITKFDWNNCSCSPDFRQGITYKTKDNDDENDIIMRISRFQDSRDSENRAADDVKISFNSKCFSKDFLDTCKSNLLVYSDLLKAERIAAEELINLQSLGYSSWQSFIEDGPCFLDVSICVSVNDKESIIKFFNGIEECVGSFSVETRRELNVILSQINPSLTDFAEVANTNPISNQNWANLFNPINSIITSQNFTDNSIIRQLK